MTRDIEFDAESVEVTGGGGYGRGVYLKVEEADLNDILVDIPLEDAVDLIGQDKILEYIGKDEVVEYFGIKEAEDEA